MRQKLYCLLSKDHPAKALARSNQKAAKAVHRRKPTKKGSKSTKTSTMQPMTKMPTKPTTMTTKPKSNSKVDELKRQIEELQQALAKESAEDSQEEKNKGKKKKEKKEKKVMQTPHKDGQKSLATPKKAAAPKARKQTKTDKIISVKCLPAIISRPLG